VVVDWFGDEPPPPHPLDAITNAMQIATCASTRMDDGLPIANWTSLSKPETINDLPDLRHPLRVKRRRVEARTTGRRRLRGRRRAQRAYFDTCRDLIASLHGLRVLRVPAPERDGDLAYRRLKQLVET
jgi:hypothetical protein